MPEATMPKLEGSETNRSERVKKFKARMESMSNATTGASVAAVGSDPLVAGVAGIMSRTVFSTISKIGNLVDMMPSRAKEEQTGDSEFGLNVQGELDINVNGNSIEDAPMGAIPATETEEPKVERQDNSEDKKEIDEATTAGIVERALQKSSEGVDRASNLASVGAGMFFGSDPIIGAAMAGLTKLGTVLGKKGLEGGANIVRGRREKKEKESPRERVREQIVENRQTKSLRRKMAVNDADIIASGSQAAIEKMETPDEENAGMTETQANVMVERATENSEGIDKMSSSVERIEGHLKDALPTPQERAEAALQSERQANNAEETKALLETVAKNTEPEEEKTGLAGLFDGLKNRGMALGGLVGGLVGSLTTIFTRTLPRLLMGAIKRIPIIALVGSMFKGLFDGVKAFMNGESVMGSIFTMIESFADSILRIFTFGLVNIEKLREWTEPVFNSIFDGIFGFADTIMSLVDKGGALLSSSIDWLFERTKMVFDYATEFIASIPEKIMNLIPGPIKGFLGLSEEEETARTNRLQGLEREYIQSTLESGEEAVGPGGPKEITEERRAELEEKLERLNREVTVSPVEENLNREVETPTPGSSLVEEDRQIIAPGRSIDSTRSEREQLAEDFNDRTVLVNLEPMKAQMRDSQALGNRINNVVQNNNSSANIITPTSKLRKEDYFAGATNREVDWN